MVVTASDQGSTRPEPYRRLSRLATGILAILTVIFGLTLLISDPNGWMLFLRSVCAAGIVGGLADWFAVEALFRHPLRIPIPHTALLRKRQDIAAENIGRFIQEYIVTPERLRETVVAADQARVIGSWLEEKKNAELCASLIIKYLTLSLGRRLGFARSGDGGQMGGFSSTLNSLLDLQRQPMHFSMTIALQRVGKSLLNDENEARELNAQLGNLAEKLVTANRKGVGDYVAETLKQWDTDVLVDRVEAEVGRDLQFIRINGAVLGGFLGGLLFLLEKIVTFG
ncbi:MAG: DUF445 family protein [Rhizobiaceae bacterium]